MTTGFLGGKFLPLHMGHVYAITKAACMVDELFVILTYSNKRDKRLCENSKVPFLPPFLRLRWLSQLTKDMENVKVVGIEDDAESDEEYDWYAGAEAIKKVIGKPIDFVFSSESTYSSIFERLYPESSHYIIDESRNRYPVSATKIRKDGPYIHWDLLPKVVKNHFVKKVVIVGTESCGKSTLTKYLAKLYNTTFVEEYGRIVCEELGGCEGILLPEDFQRIAYGHKQLEYQAIQQANKVVFIDTEANITQYYSNLYINQHQEILEGIALAQQYDLWLLLEPDVQWVDDGLRVHGDEIIRKQNHDKVKQLLDEKRVSYQILTGSYSERLETAIKLVDGLFR